MEMTCKSTTLLVYLSKHSLLYYWWKDVILLLLSKSSMQMKILKLWSIVHWVSETYVLIFMCIINVILILHFSLPFWMCTACLCIQRNYMSFTWKWKGHRFKAFYFFPSETLIFYYRVFFLEQLEGFSKDNCAINRKLTGCFSYVSVLHVLMNLKCYLILNIKIHWGYVPFFKSYITLGACQIIISYIKF